MPGSGESLWIKREFCEQIWMDKVSLWDRYVELYGYLTSLKNLKAKFPVVKCLAPLNFSMANNLIALLSTESDCWSCSLSEEMGEVMFGEEYENCLMNNLFFFNSMEAKLVET